MSDIDYYDVVEVLNTTSTSTSGISGKFGVVLGKSDGSLGKMYAVSIDDDVTYMVAESDLRATGEHRTRKDIYGDE
ncbi:hypothetical protein [Actinophytocola sediminis]